MNTMLPTPRDLPPHRRNQIRNELQRAIAGEAPNRRVRLAPLVSGLAAVAVLAVVVLLVPWRGSTPPASTVGTAPPPKSTPEQTIRVVPSAVFPGLPATEQKAIEAGCAGSSGTAPAATLYNLVTDEGGKFALLYDKTTALHCTIGGKAMPYNAGYSGVEDVQWMPGDFAVDVMAASSGGSVPGGKAESRGERGVQVAAGRVSARVTKVTYTSGNRTVDAVIANGTFVARIVHSDTWQIPATPASGTVRAYDAIGTLLGESPITPADRCWVTPEGSVLPQRGEAAPKNCLPAARWR